MPLISHKGKYSKDTNRKWLLALILSCVLACAVIGTAVMMTLWLLQGDAPQSGTTTTTTAALRPGLKLPQNLVYPQRYFADTVTPDAWDLVEGLDQTQYGLQADIPTGLGWQEVSLRVTKGGLYCDVITQIYRFSLVQTVAVDMNDDREITIRDYIADETVEAVFQDTQPSQVDRSLCGKNELTILCDGVEYTVILDVRDNIPPKADGLHVTHESGKPIMAQDLVENVEDHTEVTITFAQEVDLTVVGEHTVQVLLTDAYGNTAIVESTVTVTPARLVPEFTGLTTIYKQLNATISYKSGVSCIDPQDGELTYTVDNSQVDMTREGRYVVYYSATDSDGNTTIAERHVVVEMVTQEKVEEYAQKVLNKIITAGMTRDQKILAVYRYSRYNVTYNGYSDKSSILVAAYDGFTKLAGDCYTYYAMNTVMLNLLGIENLEVTRTGGTSHHWWNLVLFDDGQYYHVDSTPPGQRVNGIDHSKMTETDLMTYTNDDLVKNRRPNFYVYDHDLPQYQGITIAP